MKSSKIDLQIEKEKLREADTLLSKLSNQQKNAKDIFKVLDTSLHYMKDSLIPAYQYCDKQIQKMNEIDDVIAEVDKDYENIKDLNRIFLELQRKVDIPELDHYLKYFEKALYLRTLFSENGDSFDKKSLIKIDESIKISKKQLVSVFENLLGKIFNLGMPLFS